MEDLIIVDTRTWSKVTLEDQKLSIPNEITEESIITKSEVSEFIGVMIKKWLFKDPILKIPGYISKGAWPLKYIKFIRLTNEDYVILDRYDEPIDWRKVMEYSKK